MPDDYITQLDVAAGADGVGKLSYPKRNPPKNSLKMLTTIYSQGYCSLIPQARQH